MLLELLDKLATPRTVGRYNKNPRQKVQMIENLGTALQFIQKEKIKLVNIGMLIMYERIIVDWPFLVSVHSLC